jgi:hypothetical protein
MIRSACWVCIGALLRSAFDCENFVLPLSRGKGALVAKTPGDA